MATIVGDVKGLQQRHHQPRFQGPVCKSGTGTLGRVCGELGTWGRDTRDLGTSRMGRGDVWDLHSGRQIQRRGGRGDVNNYCQWSEVNAISLSS